MCLNQSEETKEGREKSIRCSLSCVSHLFWLAVGALDPPRTLQPAAPCLSKDPSAAANKRVRMGETQGEELEECTPSRRERPRTGGAAGSSEDSLDPGVEPMGVYTS